MPASTAGQRLKNTKHNRRSRAASNIEAASRWEITKKDFEHQAPPTNITRRRREIEMLGYVKEASLRSLTARGGSADESAPMMSGGAAYSTLSGESTDSAANRLRLSNEPSLTAGFVDYASTRSALELCFVNIAFYLVIAVLAFSYVFEKWTIIDSLYFGVVTFTTVGYGDLAPTTTPGRMFAIVFALYGIVILGVALGIIGERVVSAETKTMEKIRERARKRVACMFVDRKGGKGGKEHIGTESTTSKRTILGDVRELFVEEFPLLALIIAVTIFVGYKEGWTYAESIYYCIITTTTIGYGDATPSLQSMRLLEVFFIPLSVAALGAFLGKIAGFYMERKYERTEDEFLQRELTLSDLAVMDADQDGHVDMAEFLSFMLVAMQKVDREDIDQLKSLFRSLDADGSGSLQKEDLIILAERREVAQGELA